MRKLISFTHISLDGYYASANGDMRWAHEGSGDPEYQAFVQANAGSGGELIFGRVTYDMMASYWPTPMAAQQNGPVAEAMNRGPKVVFSRTITEATWNNTRLFRGDLAAEMRKLKQESGGGLAILGSGSLVAQLAAAHLIDEYQVVVDPVVLGQGRKLFEGVPELQKLQLCGSRVFANGKVYLNYGAALRP